MSIWFILCDKMFFLVKPHNPMVNSGAIMSSCLLLENIKKDMTMAQKYTYIFESIQVVFKLPHFEKFINFHLDSRKWLVGNFWVSIIQSTSLKETQLTATFLWLIFYVKMTVFLLLAKQILLIFWIYTFK